MIGIKTRKKGLTTNITEIMTHSKKIIIVATLFHLAAIVYGIIKGYWDAVFFAVVLLVASLTYQFKKNKKS